MRMTCISLWLWYRATYAKHASQQGSWIEALISSINVIALIDFILYGVMLSCWKLEKSVRIKDAGEGTDVYRKDTLSSTRVVSISRKDTCYAEKD